MKTVKQLDLSVRNETGSLSDVISLLNGNGVTVIAFYLSGKEDKGRERLIANDPEKALNILLTTGYNGEVNDVIACEMPSHPGGLNAILKSLKAFEALTVVDHFVFMPTLCKMMMVVNTRSKLVIRTTTTEWNAIKRVF